MTKGLSYKRVYITVFHIPLIVNQYAKSEMHISNSINVNIRLPDQLFLYLHHGNILRSSKSTLLFGLFSFISADLWSIFHGMLLQLPSRCPSRNPKPELQLKPCRHKPCCTRTWRNGCVIASRSKRSTDTTGILLKGLQMLKLFLVKVSLLMLFLWL